LSLPKLYKFRDLKAAGIVPNWTTARRWIEAGSFPPGFKTGPNSRCWTEESIAKWLAERERAA
jgi:hypothetical protein